MIEVESTVPSSADYAVRVSGDSMTPRFVDQQIIFIHEQPALTEGDIGIFRLNSDAYLKKLGKGCLISLNSDYAPIPIREHDDFSVFGKVVG
jgi:SOS-response transcriptional repressor LexA